MLPSPVSLLALRILFHPGFKPGSDGGFLAAGDGHPGPAPHPELACRQLLSLRVPFAEVAKPLLADDRFLQPHRSYVVNLAEADLLSAGELRMRSGARISIPRGREGAVRDAFQQWVQQQKYSLK